MSSSPWLPHQPCRISRFRPEGSRLRDISRSLRVHIAFSPFCVLFGPFRFASKRSAWRRAPGDGEQSGASPSGEAVVAAAAVCYHGWWRSRAGRGSLERGRDMPYTAKLSLKSFLLFCFLLVSLAAHAAEAPPLPPGVDRVTSVEGITEYRLANGLRVVLFPDPSKPTVTVNMTYLVGSRNEGYGETGMAHLLEHMMFKGATHHTNIPQELTVHGARPNGTTSDDRTNYFETFQATDANLEWALDLEVDRMVNSFIARNDLDSEMTVVRNEYESGE